MDDVPRYPVYANFNSRLSSFSKWSLCQDKVLMAEAGFYYTGYRDVVRCYHCGIGLKDWKEVDDPSFEHQRWAPFCPVVKSMVVITENTKNEVREKLIIQSTGRQLTRERCQSVQPVEKEAYQEKLDKKEESVFKVPTVKKVKKAAKKRAYVLVPHCECRDKCTHAEWPTPAEAREELRQHMQVVKRKAMLTEAVAFLHGYISTGIEKCRYSTENVLPIEDQFYGEELAFQVMVRDGYDRYSLRAVMCFLRKKGVRNFTVSELLSIFQEAYAKKKFGPSGFKAQILNLQGYQAALESEVMEHEFGCN